MMRPQLLAWLPDSLPDSWQHVLLLPVLLTVAGVLLYVFGRAAEFRMQGNGKWWALLPLGLALFDGLRSVSFLMDVVYRSGVDEYGRKMLVAHYAAFTLPLLSLIAIVAWNWCDTRVEHGS